MNYNEMSLEELLEKNKEITTQRDALKAEALKVSKAIEVKLADKSVRKKYDQMGKEEKKKLAQLLQAEGIESEESFGIPGAR